jgi:hypothetical protein
MKPLSKIRMAARVAECLLTLAVAACASAGSGASPGESGDSVSGDELRATGAQTLEAALYEVRPRWVSLGRQSVDVTRNQTIEVCRSNLFVYVNGRRTNESAARFSLANIETVRFLRSAAMRPDGFRGCSQTPAVDVLMRDAGR